METLVTTDTQIAFARTATRFAQDCLGKPADWIGSRLGDAGLIGVFAPEDSGGLGLGIRDALPLSIECARNDLAFPLVEAMIGAGAILKAGIGPADTLLNGSEIATIAWAGRIDAVEKPSEWRLSGVASHVIGGSYADWVVVRICGNSQEGIALVSTKSTGLSCRSGNELDVERPEMDLVFEDFPLSNAHILWDQGATWDWIWAVGKVLRSADIYGSAKASFDDSKSYTSTRKQFQRPLCANQSVRHLLARDYYGLERVRYCLEYAALSTDHQASDARVSRDVLCGLAYEICIRVAENAIQLHGAMGFTRDLPLHRRLRRILAASDICPATTARESLTSTLLDSWQ